MSVAAHCCHDTMPQLRRVILAEAQLAEIFWHCWCDEDEALRWSVLFAERAHDERMAIEEQRRRGTVDPAVWAEVIRLQAWAWIARDCASRKWEPETIPRR
jgi:hypothetical protein